MDVPYHTTDVFGVSHMAPDEDQMREVLESLEDADFGEHPYVSLTHSTGWTLSYYESGVLLWENLSDDEDDDTPSQPQRYLRNVSPEAALRYWTQLAEGRLRDLQRLQWQRHAPSEEEEE
ncbi:MAG: hypothetical protein Q7P63_02165 [Verrucomicrobiota bacterium JB022]|nr:hypothetical protein [Verrucomicrobiota bacterium JB022]